MQITILPDNNIDLNSELENYITKKVDSLEKFFPTEELDCEFKVGKNTANHKNKKVYYAEAKLDTGSKLHGARAEAETLFEAVDHLKDELSRKIRNHKAKKEGFIKRGGRQAKALLKKFLK